MQGVMQRLAHRQATRLHQSNSVTATACAVPFANTAACTVPAAAASAAPLADTTASCTSATASADRAHATAGSKESVGIDTIEGTGVTGATAVRKRYEHAANVEGREHGGTDVNGGAMRPGQQCQVTGSLLELLLNGCC